MTYELKAWPKPERKPGKRGGHRKRVRMTKHGPRTKKSGGHAFYKSGRNPAYLAALRTQPCRLCKKRGIRQTTRTQAAHVKSRATGGADLGNALSLCALHHDEQGRWGIKTFQKRYKFSMEYEAAGQTLWFLERGGAAV